MKSFLIIIACIIFLSLSVICEDVSEKGKIILEKADRRYYVEEGTYYMKVIRIDENGRETVHELEGYKKSREYQTCVWTQPRINRNDIGMRSGNVMYHKPAKFHKPNIYSYRAIFVESDFSWGDIMSSDMAYNYVVESIEEKEVEGKDVLILVLKPKLPEFYARIDTWIEKDTNNTLKRVYYTASDSILKTADYSDIQEQDGVVTSFKVVMRDDFLGTQTTAIISDITEKKLPDFLFNPNDMGKIHASK